MSAGVPYVLKPEEANKLCGRKHSWLYGWILWLLEGTWESNSFPIGLRHIDRFYCSQNSISNWYRSGDRKFTCLVCSMLAFKLLVVQGATELLAYFLIVCCCFVFLVCYPWTLNLRVWFHWKLFGLVFCWSWQAIQSLCPQVVISQGVY